LYFSNANIITKIIKIIKNILTLKFIII
jgi:hypothetical protein